MERLVRRSYFGFRILIGVKIEADLSRAIMFCPLLPCFDVDWLVCAHQFFTYVSIIVFKQFRADPISSEQFCSMSVCARPKHRFLSYKIIVDYHQDEVYTNDILSSWVGRTAKSLNIILCYVIKKNLYISTKEIMEITLLKTQYV